MSLSIVLQQRHPARFKESKYNSNYLIC